MIKMLSIRQIDPVFAMLVLLLSSVGLVMMGSASVEFSAEKYGMPFFYIYRQLIFLLMALLAAVAVFYIPSRRWYQMSGFCLLAGFLLLIAVIIPGIGHEVNGSMRWIPLGPINLQSSEPAKLLILIYLAGYLVRRQKEVQEHYSGLLKPVVVLLLVIALLLKEPDFGSAIVLMVTYLGMIFLSGVGLKQFSVLIVCALAAAAVVIDLAEYRVVRLKCFIDPWDQPYDCGYQLTQSLIAFGRGEWFGLGLGNSIQKLLYLPEAHTDFVFAILAEELGFMGSAFVLLVFSVLIYKIFSIAHRAQKIKHLFSAYLAYGIALVISSQVFINIGVNVGVLPTKGLTLPFFSYGGSSLIVSFIMMGILARIDVESNVSQNNIKKDQSKKVGREPSPLSRQKVLTV